MPLENPLPTVTLQLLPEMVSQAIMHLVTWCIQESHAFLQTYYHDSHTEVEIRNQQQEVLVHLVLYSVLPDALALEAASRQPFDTLPPESAALVRRLLHLCMTS